MSRLNTVLWVLVPTIFAGTSTALAQNATEQAPAEAAVAHARLRAEAMAHALAALPRECMLGNATQPDGAWALTRHAEGEPSSQLAEVHSFEVPIRTATFQIVLDQQGWKQLDHVDVRGADGAWQTGWSGPKQVAPATCEFIRVRQTLARAVDASALRLVFRRETGEFTAGDVGVLPLAQR